MASKPWEDGEKDGELFREIGNLFEMNKVLDEFDNELATLMQARLRIDEEATSEEEKAAMEKTADDLTRMIEKEKEKGQRRVPGLKVLSAVAVCKKYKDSEEILNLVSQGHRMKWADTCMGLCQVLEENSSSRCGFCRSVAQIK